MLFSPQGPLKIADRMANGFPAIYRGVGSLDPAAGLNFEPKVTTFPVYETESGQRSLVDNLIQGTEGALKFKLREWNSRNLALQLLGPASVIDAGTVTGETFPTGLEAGDQISLRHQKVSSVVLTDSAGSPATLVANTNYTLDDADFGNLTIVSLSGLTQPIKAAYSYAERIQIAHMSGPLVEKAIRVEIVNTANSMGKVLVEFYRAQFEVAKVQQLILEKGVATGEMEVKILADLTKPVDGTMGRFGRIIDLGMTE